MRAAAAAAAAAAAVAGCALAVLTAVAPTAAYAAAAERATITRSAHVAFAGCNAQHVILSVTAPTRSFTPDEPVTIKVRLTNTGSTTCGGPLAQHVPQARQTLTIGPCGTMPLVVRNHAGVEVYPGPTVFHCPMETGFQLGPHSTARATATWSEAADIEFDSGQAPKPAPPGIYRLSVDRAVTVPVTLTSG
jgi:hypothetical protein